MFVQDIGFDEGNTPVISRSTKYQNFVINFNAYHYEKLTTRPGFISKM